jgi:formate-dependent nitrite reductase membrane component NrfD
MKYGSIVCTVLFVLGVCLSLAQMWLSLLDPELFWKLLITMGAFFVIALGITLVVKEYLSEKEMKKKGYID